MDLLLQFAQPGFNNYDNNQLGDFLNLVSEAINEKIINLENQYNIKIKLTPLSTINTRSNNYITIPVTSNGIINGNYVGNFTFDTEIDISPMLGFGPYLIDPFGQSEQNNRIPLIKHYLETLIKIRTQLEEFEAGTITKDKLDLRYFSYLPEKKTISVFMKPTGTNVELKSTEKSGGTDTSKKSGKSVHFSSDTKS